MEAIRRQTVALMESAALSASKDEKLRAISSLVELALFRADAPLVEDIVASVSQFVSDRAAPVRKCALDFLEKVAASDKGGADLALRAVHTASFLVADDVDSVALKAFKVATRLVGRGMCFAAGGDDCDTRLRLAAPLLEGGRADLGQPAVECALAVLLRDAANDTAAGLKKGSASTKGGAARLAAATKQPRVSAAALDATGSALKACFDVVHRELVAAVISALDGTLTSDGKSDDGAVRAAAARAGTVALHAAEKARQAAQGAGVTGGGAVAAAAAKIEAALRRAGQGAAADEALRAARAGEVLGAAALGAATTAALKKEPAAAADSAPAAGDAMEVEDVDDPLPLALAKRGREGDAGAEGGKRRAAEPIADLGRPLDASGAGALVLGSSGGGAAVLTATAAPLAKSHAEQMRAFVTDRVAAGAVGGAAWASDLVARLVRYELASCDAVPHGAILLAVEKYDAGGFDMAMRLLFDAHVVVVRAGSTQAYDETLLALLAALRDAYQDSRDNRNLFTDTVIAAPRFPSSAIAFLVACCDGESASPGCVALGLAALRDAAFARPAARAACVEAVLRLSSRGEVHPAVRDKAVRLASNQFWPRVVVQAAVVNFARLRLEEHCAAAFDGAAPESDDDEAVTQARTELSLFIALCVKDPELFPELLVAAARNVRLSAQGKTEAGPVHRAVAAELPRLAPALATGHGCEATLRNAARIFDDDAQFFDAHRLVALRLVEILGPQESLTLRPGLWDGACALRDAAERAAARKRMLAEAPTDGGAPPTDAAMKTEADSTKADSTKVEPTKVEPKAEPTEAPTDAPPADTPTDAAPTDAAPMDVAPTEPTFEATDADRRSCVGLLVPALAAADVDRLALVLPLLLNALDDDALGSALKQAASAPRERSKAPRLSAADVLVVLHRLDDDSSVSTKRLTEAVGICLALRDTFGASPLRDALERMTAAPAGNALPQMLMRTAILAVKMYPSQLAGFVAGTVLSRLATALAVWQNAPLWKGFMMCCTMLGDENAPNCFAAALSLPPAQLQHLLRVAPKLKAPLKRHAQAEQQKAATKSEPPPFQQPTLKVLGIEA
ncbi:Symplekin tight junction protein C terminal-domain-containing protein [Pelagophyceae sp. CCMP2097]|nr:Symplekin tight junction protein C terminal-domain-containing protein [Pelagophyceae sp. CCMP2097]